MTKRSTNTPSRNALCACGSGRKSKLCCSAAPPAQAGRDRKPWLLVIGLIGVIAIAIYAIAANRPSAVTGTTTPPVGISTPHPWQYDAASNQHWDPTHQHWHQGRPPASAGVADTNPPVSVAPTTPPAPATGTGILPKPWQYDVVNNQHWDPTHQHWHKGPPPQTTRP